MEAAGEDLDNIFEDYESRENEETNREGINEEANDETSAGVKIQVPKRVVRNPRVKFNPERLCGERGLPILVDHFKNVKFKGIGYEKEDLDKLLSKLEHWTHRLFPSMKFEDCVHHIEKLGKKRPVQTCLSKIRLDMPILANDFIKDNEEDDVQRNDDVGTVETDAFDRLLGENQNFNPLTTVDSEMNSSFSTFSSLAQRESPSESSGQVLGSSGLNLTEEQKERLERNRMLAIERRKARLAAAQQNATESLLDSNERVHSQEDPIAPSFDSLKRNEINTSDDFFTNNNHSPNKNSKSILPELNNPNSDNLGLDDLIALVDGEELDANKKLTTTSLEQSAVICVETTDVLPQVSKLSSPRQTTSCSTSDDANNSITLPLKTLGSTKDEGLELDSLVDLINDNSEESQNPDPVKISVHNTQDKNLSTSKEVSSAMDYEDEGSLNNFDSESLPLVIDEDL